MLIRFQINRSEMKGGGVENRFEIYKNWIESYVHFFQRAPAVSKKFVLYHPDKHRVETMGAYSIASFLASEHFYLYGEGPGFKKLMESESGLELFCFSSHGFEYGGVEVFPLRKRESLTKACKRVSESEPNLIQRSSDIYRIRHEKGLGF